MAGHSGEGRPTPRRALLTWREYPTAARRLLLARASRSVGQGMLVVNFVLYLKDLGWHAGVIGLLMSGAGLAGAGLALVIGTVSDRLGRKPFILTYETLTIVAGLVAFLTPNPILLSLAAVLASFGRGQNGGAGPFGPAEQAWLARLVTPAGRSRLFSLNAAVGFVGMGLGALLAGTVAYLHHWWPGAAAFRPLFLLVVAGSTLNWLMLWPLADPPPARPTRVPSSETTTRVTREENRALLKLSLSNALNGLAVGLTGPLVSYWFAVRFGSGPALIGGLMALAFVATGFSNLATGRLAEQFGPVRSVVVIRLVGVAFLLAMTVMTSFWWAGLFYVLRSLVNRGSVGARQAVSVSLTRDERRGLASSLNQASMRVPASIGPTIAGYLMDAGNLTLPFLLAAGLQLAYALTYGRFFGHLDHGLRTRGAEAAGARPPSIGL
jgi:MFS family permease